MFARIPLTAVAALATALAAAPAWAQSSTGAAAQTETTQTETGQTGAGQTETTQTETSQTEVPATGTGQTETGQTETQPQYAPADIDTVIATVGGTDITLGAVIALRAGLPQQYQQIPPQVLLPGLVDQLVDQEVLSQSVETLSRETEITIANQTRAARAGQRVAEVLRAELPEAEIEAAYQERIKDFEGGREYQAAHILVETEEEAREIAEQARGGADFAELAKEKSTGPSGPAGGDLGWFGEGMMVEPFEAALKAMQPGDISDPVQTQFGWHVIKLNESRDAQPPALEEMRPEIEAELKQKLVQDAVAELKAGAEIERIDLGTIDPAIVGRYDLLTQ